MKRTCWVLTIISHHDEYFSPAHVWNSQNRRNLDRKPSVAIVWYRNLCENAEFPYMGCMERKRCSISGLPTSDLVNLVIVCQTQPRNPLCIVIGWLAFSTQSSMAGALFPRLQGVLGTPVQTKDST